MKNEVLFNVSILSPCMHAYPRRKKITIKEPFTLEIWAAKDLTFCCGRGLMVMQIGEQLPWYLTVRVEYGQQERCVAAGHKNGGHL